MPEFTQIIRSLSPELFNDVLSASSRQSREVYFHRHGIKAPPASRGFSKPGAKNAARAHALFEALAERKDEELSEEVLRTWLLSKRPLLSAALDHLKIAHVDGLTDSDDVERFTKLGTGEVKALVKALSQVGTPDEIRIYLEYMGTPHVQEALG
jgi:hypothetical protein